MRKQSVGSKFIRETCVAGAVIDETIKYSMTPGKGKRAAKTQPTREAVMRNNDRVAVKKLARLMNANFFPGDWHLTLTYAGDAPSQAQAKKCISDFKNHMRRECRKIGKEFKFIEVTEYTNHRIHHHMLVNYIDKKIIEDQWIHGSVNFKTLDRSRNYRKLAEYFVKETTKTMREPGNETKKRWNPSRNLTRPIVKREIVNPSVIYENPREFKGYQIDEDTVRRFEHPFTHIEHLEYMMVSTDPVPRIKTWRKGKVVEKDETYRRASEVQICMDSLDGWDFI